MILAFQDVFVQMQILIAVFGIMGAGISAYVGVRVAQAKIQQDIKNLRDSDDRHDERLDRLEQPYFEPRPYRKP